MFQLWGGRAASQEDRRRLGQITVVLADDEQEFVADFKAAAEAAGFSVTSYASADQFITGMLQSHETRGHLFVLDIQMEDDQAGFRALERVKESPVHRKAPIIMVSQSMKREDVCLAYEKGASLFIRKSRNPRVNKKSLQDLFSFLRKEEVRFCERGIESLP